MIFLTTVTWSNCSHPALRVFGSESQTIECAQKNAGPRRMQSTLQPHYSVIHYVFGAPAAGHGVARYQHQAGQSSHIDVETENIAALLQLQNTPAELRCFAPFGPFPVIPDCSRASNFARQVQRLCS